MISAHDSVRNLSVKQKPHETLWGFRGAGPLLAEGLGAHVAGTVRTTFGFTDVGNAQDSHISFLALG